MADKKGKTKAAILQELESIKGLLLEEDAPVLQPISHEQVYPDRPLPKHDLKKLHHEFQALNNAISSTTDVDVNAELSEDYVDDENTLEEIDYPPHNNQPTSKIATSLDAHYQASLFQNTSNDHLTQQTETNLAPQKNHVADPLNYAVKKSITPSHSSRQTVTKASGENPFLPQHIRERLQGNNPFPTFELNEMIPVYKSEQPLNKNETAHPPTYKVENSTVSKSDASSAPKIDTSTVTENSDKRSTAQKDAQISRHALIHEVVDAVMPQIEIELRQRLEHMTEDQLLELLSAH